MKDEPPIAAFEGRHRFLSNFWPCEIPFGGKTYPSVEHAFQAAKTLDEDEREEIRLADSPGKAKKLGRKITLRPDWEEVKFEIMTELVRSKFIIHQDLRDKLIFTGGRELIEGNNWNDVVWGVCKGIGDNNLGKILMQVRDELFMEAL